MIKFLFLIPLRLENRQTTGDVWSYFRQKQYMAKSLGPHGMGGDKRVNQRGDSTGATAAPKHAAANPTSSLKPNRPNTVFGSVALGTTGGPQQHPFRQPVPSTAADVDFRAQQEV